MIKNDYLTAKLHELSEVISKIYKLLENEKILESHEVINEGFKRLLGLNPDIVESLSYKDLINFIGAYESADSIKLIILAELLKLDGDIYKLEDNLNKSFSLYLKSFNVYVKALLIDSDTVLSQFGSNINTLVEEIAEYETPYDTQYSLFQYFEIAETYDKAEDMLYELIDASANDADIIKEGVSFYKRLLEKSDTDLNAGNLPRVEIEEALEDLQRP